jgi:hypothetical protein
MRQGAGAGGCGVAFFFWVEYVTISEKSNRDSHHKSGFFFWVEYVTISEKSNRDSHHKSGGRVGQPVKPHPAAQGRRHGVIGGASSCKLQPSWPSGPLLHALSMHALGPHEGRHQGTPGWLQGAAQGCHKLQQYHMQQHTLTHACTHHMQASDTTVHKETGHSCH